MDPLLSTVPRTPPPRPSYSCPPPPQVLTSQALVGTVIALAGTWAYTEMSSKYKTKKAPPATGGDSKPATA